MKFAIDDTGAEYKIAAYDKETVRIYGNTLSYPVLVSNNTITTELTSQSAENITDSDLTTIIEKQPQILIIGTGDKMIFLTKEQLQRLNKNRIGVEIMTTPAACRTFNVLLSEDRDVMVLLFE